MGSFSIWHWLIVLVIVMLVFGTKKLRNIGQDLGGAVKGFKDGMKEADQDGDASQKIGNGNGQTIEASIRFKDGAQVCNVADLHEPQWSTLDVSVVQRVKIIRTARDMVGRPFPSGLAMAVGILRRHRGDITAPYADQPWWVRTLLNGEHTAYCLQVPYYAYRAAGIDLTPDGRPEGLVRPADLLPLVAAA